MEINKDKIYWEQRAWANWLQLGDKNSVFFHKYALVRRWINTISRLESDKGGKITDETEINKAATLFFQKLFSSNGIEDLSHLLTGIEINISSDINTSLLSAYTTEEVHSVLKGIWPTKAPGSDGFPTLFFSDFGTL